MTIKFDSIKKLSLLLFGSLITLFTSNAQHFQQIELNSEQLGLQYSAHVLQLDLNSLKSDFTALRNNAENSMIIDFPFPDGSIEAFEVKYQFLMHPDLQVKFPEIYTVKGSSKQSPAYAKFDITPKGFHGFILSDKGTIYIEPIENSENLYAVFWKHDYQNAFADERLEFSCGTAIGSAADEVQTFGLQKFKKSANEQVETRKYRTAISCTGGYGQFHGGTVLGALSAIVTTLNRVAGIYERDFAIFMELIADNDQLLHFDDATDPFSNNDNSALLGQNQSFITQTIGTGGYDIGHVFSRIGGGIASLRSVCVNNRKAQGVTGRAAPIGDPFDVDYVAHEMGHQFGGNHTQNNSCNRNASTAVEPGSASTIMGYAGICPPNIQSNSDDYFHAVNYDEIMNYTLSNNGYNCAQKQVISNRTPIAIPQDNLFAVPVGTPYFLRGSATDSDGDFLSYCWEQMDLGPSGSPTNPQGSAPMYRSWSPKSESTRFLPTLIGVLSGFPPQGEVFSTYGRTVNFRLTVRDNNLGGGGVGFSQIIYSITDDAGPFVVTSPSQGFTAERGSAITVNWDVANTDQTPINCSKVHVLFSPDQGQTWTDTLAKNVDNIGIANVVLPDTTSTLPRIIVVSADNVFFNIGPFFQTNQPNPFIAAPIELVAISFNSNDASLEWTDVANNESFYLIERSNDNNLWTLIDSVPGNTVTYLDENVDLSQSVFYRVRARNTLSFSAYSNVATLFNTSRNEPFKSTHVNLYPNPNTADGILRIYSERSLNFVQIIDISGRILLNQNIENSSNQHRLTIPNLAKGMYHVRLESADEFVVKTMIIN